MNNNDTRNRLIELGVERLADALIELAGYDDKAGRVVELLVASPRENVEAFTFALEELKEPRRYIDWRGASDFARELEDMLDSLGAGCDDPAVGIEQITAFFEADELMFEQCDDSGGNVGSVFDGTACDLFARYALDHPDKSMIIDLVIRLIRSDEYGARSCLIDGAHRFLSPEMLRELARRIGEENQRENNSCTWRRALASVARQLKDAPLYEQTLRAMHSELRPSVYPDIANAYMEAGDPKTALDWLKRAKTEGPGAYVDRRLLLRVYLEVGDIGKAEEVAWRIFNTYRSSDTLTTLLSVIGEDRRGEVVEDVVRNVLSSKAYSTSDAKFLIGLGRMDDAEEYLLNSAEKLDGGEYYYLLPIAETMEKDGRYLAAVAVYRALLDSLLSRGVSKAYHHGVEYLNKLDVLEKNIDDWKQFPDHTAYKTAIAGKYRRKWSFWSLYNRPGRFDI